MKKIVSILIAVAVIATMSIGVSAAEIDIKGAANSVILEAHHYFNNILGQFNDSLSGIFGDANDEASGAIGEVSDEANGGLGEVSDEINGGAGEVADEVNGGANDVADSYNDLADTIVDETKANEAFIALDEVLESIIRGIIDIANMLEEIFT